MCPLPEQLLNFALVVLLVVHLGTAGFALGLNYNPRLQSAVLTSLIPRLHGRLRSYSLIAMHVYHLLQVIKLSFHKSMRAQQADPLYLFYLLSIK